MFSDAPSVFVISAAMQVSTLIPWYLVKFLANKHKIVFLSIYATYMLMLIVIPCWKLSNSEFSLFMSFAAAMEQVRILMKVHSFVIEIYFKQIDSKKDKNATLYNLVYFLFAPTLIYRHNYPRTKKINWRAVISYFLQFIGTIFCMFATIRRFVANNYASSGIEPFNAKTLLSSLLVTGCLGMSLMFLGWYGLLQCWLNGWAEMLRFADRMFYDEWWTSSQFSKYFRKWNLVVSDWLHTYLYQPINDMSGKRWLAALATFAISGVAHEYIMALATGFFFPFLFIEFLGFGAGLFWFFSIPSNGIQELTVHHHTRIIFWIKPFHDS
ncbi:hypothetical protein B4U79_10051, partial [Dinothrombium tinctorium]